MKTEDDKMILFGIEFSELALWNISWAIFGLTCLIGAYLIIKFYG